MAFLSGKSGHLSILSDDYKIKRWSVDLPNEILDVTNGGGLGGGAITDLHPDGGYGEFIAGVSDVTFTVDLDHDVGTSPFVTDFVPGTIVTVVKLYANSNSPLSYWQICAAIIQDVSESLDARGLASIHISAKATGGNYAFHEADDDIYACTA